MTTITRATAHTTTPTPADKTKIGGILRERVLDRRYPNRHRLPAPPVPTPGNPLADALRSILAEVTPGTRPYSGDSYLPHHLVESAQAVLTTHDRADIVTQQHAHNALTTAAWHCARGEPAKALARLRRANSHIMTMMEGVTA